MAIWPITQNAPNSLSPKKVQVIHTNTKNTYSNVVNSIVRPNVSYASVTKNKTTNHSHIPQQMATDNSENSFVSLQPQANQVKIPPTITQSQSNNPNLNLINRTIQGIIQALSALTVQIKNMNFVDPSP
ncbi:hypothetical protein TNCV_4117951 [Trichonephila clavipes]|nr:hypothetical protein TNCV_4117951 [Trichonephila clavipes]